MRDKVKVLTYCSHFDEIINYDFLEDDVFTKKLIQYYQDFVVKTGVLDDNLGLIKSLDEALYKYTQDYHFAKSLKDTLDVNLITNDNFSYLDQLMKYIVDYFKTYDENNVVIKPTKWI